MFLLIDPGPPWIWQYEFNIETHVLWIPWSPMTLNLPVYWKFHGPVWYGISYLWSPVILNLPVLGIPWSPMIFNWPMFTHVPEFSHVFIYFRWVSCLGDYDTVGKSSQKSPHWWAPDLLPWAGYYPHTGSYDIVPCMAWWKGHSTHTCICIYKFVWPLSYFHSEIFRPVALTMQWVEKS